MSKVDAKIGQTTPIEPWMHRKDFRSSHRSLIAVRYTTGERDFLFTIRAVGSVFRFAKTLDMHPETVPHMFQNKKV